MTTSSPRTRGSRLGATSASRAVKATIGTVTLVMLTEPVEMPREPVEGARLVIQDVRLCGIESSPQPGGGPRSQKEITLTRRRARSLELKDLTGSDAEEASADAKGYATLTHERCSPR